MGTDWALTDDWYLEWISDAPRIVVDSSGTLHALWDEGNNQGVYRNTADGVYSPQMGLGSSNTSPDMAIDFV